MVMPNRRDVMRGLSAGVALGTLGLRSRRAMAAVGASDRKFIFVVNQGGWDPTTVFAPMFGLSTIDMEPDAQPMTFGGLTLVDSAQRPSVRAFFSRWHERAVVLNGVSVRSLSHDICTMVSLTGNSSGLAPDWATHLAGARRADFTLPHLVLGGPSFSGDLAASVARSGASGQLDGLLDGELFEGADQEGPLPSPAAEQVLDRWMRRRAAAALQGATRPEEVVLTSDLAESLDRAAQLKERRHDLSFDPGPSLATQGPAAIDALARGISRCVTISEAVSWDTHANNAQQSALFESLFGRLLGLFDRLETTPGTEGGTLLDETVVVVLSEMGRTPKLNASQGRDHWPYTSMLMVGPGLTGSRTVGGFDPRYNGVEIDPRTGEPGAGRVIRPASVGATLLQLAGIDPGPVLPGETAITGMLA